MRESQIRFMQQLGYPARSVDNGWYAAAMFQPKVIGGVVALGIVFQKPWLFLALSAALWWSVLVPPRNPFDAIYNRFVLRARGLPPLAPAPAPRRFAQGLAAAFALGIAIALQTHAAITAGVLEALYVVAVVSAIVRDLCAGAVVYHLLTRNRLGRGSPSARGEAGSNRRAVQG